MLKSALKKIFVLIGIIWLLFFIGSAVLTVLVSFHKNDISKVILFSLNAKQNGEFKLDNINFVPLRHFPNLSINLSNLSYFERKSSKRNSDEQPIARINNFYLGLNLADLLRGNLNVSKIIIDDGDLTIVTYPDSSINLIKALGIKEKMSESEEKKETVLNIQKLLINDLHLRFKNYLKERESTFLVKNLEVRFEYKNQEAYLDLITSILVENVKLNEILSLQNRDLDLNIKLHMDKDKKLEVKEGKLELEKTVFKFDGSFNPKNDGELLLNIDGSDASLDLFSQLLREEEKKKFKKGDFYFRGTVSGKTFTEFPLIDFSIDLKNVELVNPSTNRKIKNLNLKGHFNSGNKDDFSKAILKVDTLYADFPSGSLKLSGSVKNFSIPEFDVQFFLNADLTGLDKVFKLDFMENLKGKIEIDDRFKGKYILKEKKFLSDINIGNIFFEDFGFNIPGIFKIDRLNGHILRKKDDYYFDNLSLISDDTDILINGKIENLQYLIFSIEKDINADLKIKSSIFDLPNFLAFDPSIKRDFNHRILNVDVDVYAKTTTSKATKFKSFPEIEFDIRKLNATAENFLPPLKIQSGRFKVSENILGFNLKFDKFQTKFLDGNFNFTGEYNSSKYQPFYIKLNTDFKKISPSILFYDKGDTIPDFLTGKLSGSFFSEFQFPLDSTILKFVNLKDGNFIYYSPTDTIELKSLRLNFSNIYYNDKLNSNPLTTLSTSGKFATKEIITKYFVLKNGELNIKVDNGEYEIGSGGARLFGENAKGTSFWKLKPFADIPEFQIKYDVKEFYIEEMLSVFLEDTIVTGPLSLHLDISSRGSDWETLRNNTFGSINLSGKNLTFYGLDADKLIEKFKRSQSFNLIDLGAVMLAGPVGIAVTKGSDYASILIIDSGESSNITRLVSNWDISNANYTIRDAAFTTTKNRVAAKGFINFSKNSLDLSVALLNKNGCSIFSQRVYGDLDSPTLGSVKVVKTILAPLTNLVDDILGIECDVFYNGTVKQPK